MTYGKMVVIFRMVKRAVFKFQPFSLRQKKVLTWWMAGSGSYEKDGIIADGAIRSGKTVSMSLSFVLWAMTNFDNQGFAMCGKTIGSFRRNVLFVLKLMLLSRGFRFKDRRSDNLLVVTRGGVTNYFYIFGGKDESSQDLIQGLTLAGVFFDEVALMPESFVNQATGRCSVEGSKFWFNCNPEGPYHWFKLEWIDKCGTYYLENGKQKKGKNMLYLHFTMADNLSLSKRIKERYCSMYNGVFYDRYILGKWAVAEGVIYAMFDQKMHSVDAGKYQFVEYHVSCDYGTQNPTVFGLWGKTVEGKHIMIKEYYYSGRDENSPRSDIEYARDMQAFVKGYKVKYIIVDPSASSFITQLRNDGFKVLKGRNDVLDGIRLVATLLTKGTIFFDHSCINTFKEFGSYVWDLKAAEMGADRPVEKFDHSMDQVRYYANTIIQNRKPRQNMSRGGVKS